MALIDDLRQLSDQFKRRMQNIKGEEATKQALILPFLQLLGYDIYDIVVNQGVKGPLGFVGGVAAFLFGVSRLFSNIMIGIPTIVAAVCLIKADSILQTFGMVI